MCNDVELIYAQKKKKKKNTVLFKDLAQVQQKYFLLQSNCLEGLFNSNSPVLKSLIIIHCLIGLP